MRKRAFLGGVRTVTVRCGGCSVRNGVIFTIAGTPPRSVNTAAGPRTWDGVVLAKSDPGPNGLEVVRREYASGYHHRSRHQCQACGRAWPDDDSVTRIVLAAEQSGTRSAVLEQLPPPRVMPSRDWYN